MKQITIVVGAGASSEFGLPTGKRLLELIAGMAKRQFEESSYRYALDNDLKAALKSLIPVSANASNDWIEINRVYEEATWLSGVALMAPSIDNLLHSHKENSTIDRIGKLFICKAILQAESASCLANTKQSDGYIGPFALVRGTHDGPEYISDKWIGKLFALLVEMRSFSDFLSILGRLNFLCFNYDRCIEQAITSLAMRYYRLSDQDGRRVLETLKITHIYGSLGELIVVEGRVAGYGNTGMELATAAKSIHTFTDVSRRSQIKSIVFEALTGSSIALFMGYGFLQINNSLFFDGPHFDFDRVLATAKGLSEASVSTIRSEIEDSFLFGSKNQAHRADLIGSGRPDKVVLSNQSCAELIDYHSVFLRRALTQLA